MNINMNERKKRCEVCEGSGYEPAELIICSVCQGRKCARCVKNGGYKQLWLKTCTKCYGAGENKMNESSVTKQELVDGGPNTENTMHNDTKKE